MNTEPPKKTRGRPKKMVGEQTLLHVRLTQEHRDKLDRLGGADWLRSKLDEAQDPGEGSRARGPWLEKGAEEAAD